MSPAAPSTHQSTIFLVLRRLRAPLITLLVIMSVSVLGLTLAPGPVVDGQPTRMSFFHAFYFISYTATTIGFGEIPNAFSEQQRLWTLVCIYLSVVGWAYTLGTVFSLLQDKTFRTAVAVSRFARAVRSLHEPFFVVCGYGETGRLICKALDQLGYRAVVIEVDEVKAGELELHSYHADIPTLVADASKPEVLTFAGLTSQYCRGVIALTNDDQANLAIAISARLLAPNLPALCRAESTETAANMASFGTRHIINPFAKFSEYLALALHAPDSYQLVTWLTGLPGTHIERNRPPPRGPWILCGYGRFGRVLVDTLEKAGLPVTVIDHTPPTDPAHRWVRGDGTGATALQQAGVEQAAGIIASTAHDVNNLSIAVTGRQLNRKLFTVVRQNHYANHVLFDAYDADITVIPSQIIAHECLAILTTPLLAPFLDILKHADQAWGSTLLQRLTGRFGWAVPTVWSVRLNLSQAPALYRQLMRQRMEVSLQDLLCSPSRRDDPLAAEVLYLMRDDDDDLLLPDPATVLRPGDELLLVGDANARRDLALTLANAHTLAYVLTGEDLPGGWIWERLASRRQRRQPQAAG